MAIPLLTPLPQYPSRQTLPENWAVMADAFVAAEYNMVNVDMNTKVIPAINGATSSVEANKNAAATSATNASNSATSAQTSATNAANSATAANTSRTQAQTSATNAANSATSASNSATTATAQADRAKAEADRAESIVGPVGTAAGKDAQTSTADATSGRLMLVGAGGILGAALGSTAGPAALPGGMWYDTSLNTFPVSTPFLNVSGARSFALGARDGSAWIYTYGDAAPRLLTLLTDFNTFPIGQTRAIARERLGITDSPGRVQPENWIGNVATSAAQTVNIDVTANESSSMSMDTANTTGSLTINFTNIPNTSLGYCVWYVDILRAGRKTVNFTLPAGNTLRWAGGAVPVLSDVQGHRTQIMFEKKLGMQTVYASVVREGLFN